jgi:serine/threonine protein kinase
MGEEPLRIAEELASTPYRHVRGLARGGTADVHVVEHRALGGEAVMKIVRAPDEEMGEVLTKRLLAEGRMLRRLRHPNIVEVLDFGFTASKRAFLVTELLRGKTLKEEVLRREAPLDLEEARRVLVAVLEGLEAAHAAGLVHRDLKPDNVFYLDAVGDAPRGVKILDFGIAKIVSADPRSAAASTIIQTQQGFMLGTPMYAAPEQIAAESVDARADIYAAGGLFYFLITGRAPFLGRSSYELLQAHISEIPEPPSAHVPTIPDAVDAFVLRALRKRPAERFVSAAEMRRELLSLSIVPRGGLARSAAASRPESTAADQATEYRSSPIRVEPPPPERKPAGPVLPQPFPRRTELLAAPEPMPRTPDPHPMRQTPAPAPNVSREDRLFRFALLVFVVLAVAMVAAVVFARCARAAEGLPAERGFGYLQHARGANVMSSTQGVGPQGTFKMGSPAIEALESAVTAPQPFDEPTPIDPPVFDIEALAKQAALAPRKAQPTAKTQTGALVPGTIFKGYVVSGLFAEGGMALLYEATHPESLRRCLIKLLKEQYRSPHHAVLQKKHLAEGKLLMHAGGRNPYLVVVHDVGDDPVVGPYYIMDKLEGRTLYSYMRQQFASGATFEPDSAARLGVLVAEGLRGMHEQGVVHRDIKPLNIFILDTRGGAMQIVLLDWGAAKSQFSPHTSLEDVTIGTAAYMAPEQITRGIITGAVDQFALGYVLLEMMWRHPHLDGTPRDPQEIARLNVHRDVPEPPPHLVPAPLFQILRRAVDRDYRNRFPSCRAFADALRGYLAAPQARASAPLVTRMPHKPTIPKDARAMETQAARASTPHAPIVDVPTPCPRIALTDRSDEPTLAVLSPATLRGLRFVLSDGLVIGRHPGLASLVLDDGTVSNRHARLDPVVMDPDAPVFTLSDLGSTNGTTVQDRALTEGDIGSLRSGDVVVFGDVRAVLLPAGVVHGDFASFERRGAQLLPAAVAAPAGPGHPSRDAHPTVEPAPGLAPAGQASAAGHLPARPRLAPRIETYAESSRPSFLVLQPREMRGLRFEIGERGFLGADPARADVLLDHPTVSGRHASYTHVTGEVSSDALTYAVEDAGSTNGVARLTNDLSFELVIMHAVQRNGTVRLGDVEIMLLPSGKPDRVLIEALARSGEAPQQLRAPKRRVTSAVATVARTSSAPSVWHTAPKWVLFLVGLAVVGTITVLLVSWLNLAGSAP